VVLMGMVSVQAGDACCKAGKAGGAAAKAGCADVWSQLNVTPEQQAKIDALKAECDEGACEKAAHAKFKAGIQQILTAEQFAQLKGHCDKRAKGGACPFTSTQEKKEPKS